MLMNKIYLIHKKELQKSNKEGTRHLDKNLRKKQVKKRKKEVKREKERKLNKRNELNNPFLY